MLYFSHLLEDEDTKAVINATEECYVRIQQVSAEKFFQRFLP